MAGAHMELVYKLVTAAAWQEAERDGAFDGSADDRRDGYIHLSSAAQLAGTAQKYFTAVEGLVLVAFDADSLGAALVWEPSRGGQLFPHYYGELPTAAALFVRPLRLDPTGVPCVREAVDP